MLERLLKAPSFNSLVITGTAILFALFVFLKHNKSFFKMDHYKQIKLLFMFTIAIGIHGLLHLGLEYVYNFNPYTWI